VTEEAAGPLHDGQHSVRLPWRIKGRRCRHFGHTVTGIGLLKTLRWTHLRLLVELSEQKTSLEIRIREMTPDQRRQYATELLAKARTMLPTYFNAKEAEYPVSTNGIREREAEADDGGDEV
jgi:hypothetical protein